MSLPIVEEILEETLLTFRQTKMAENLNVRDDRDERQLSIDELARTHVLRFSRVGYDVAVQQH